MRSDAFVRSVGVVEFRPQNSCFASIGERRNNRVIGERSDECTNLA